MGGGGEKLILGGENIVAFKRAKVYGWRLFRAEDLYELAARTIFPRCDRPRNSLVNEFFDRILRVDACNNAIRATLFIGTKRISD